MGDTRSGSQMGNMEERIVSQITNGNMMKTLAATCMVILLLVCSSGYGQQPYNPSADVRSDIKSATLRAKQENKHVLVQFGGNWCPWCLRFHALATTESLIDSLLRADYIYVLANVPKEKNQRDWTLFREYDYPNRFGFPVFVILDGEGRKLNIQDSGLLEHCSGKGYDTTKVVNFLKMWTFRALDPDTYQPKK
jgi:thioredoxin-related protein